MNKSNEEQIKEGYICDLELQNEYAINIIVSYSIDYLQFL